MRITVDQQRCQGHTVCALTAPDLFDLRAEDGHAVPVDPTPGPEHAVAARQAASACPEQAIAVDD